MEYVDFMRLCGNSLYDDTKTFTNSKGSTVTITLTGNEDRVVWPDNTNAKRNERGCYGTFVFTDKLDSITR